MIAAPRGDGKRPDGRQVEWRWIFVAEGGRGSWKAGACDIPDGTHFGGAARMTLPSCEARLPCPMFMQIESRMSKRSLDFDATPSMFSATGF
jgi:hypothetical protein